MKKLLMTLKENGLILESNGSDFNIKNPYKNIFDYGNIKRFPEGKYHISIRNKNSHLDYNSLNDFASYLNELYGADVNDYMFNSNISDKSIRYSLCFDFDRLYDGSQVSLILEYWDGVVTLSFLGCESIILLDKFFSE